MASDWKMLTIVLPVLGFTAADYHFVIFKLLTIVLSVLGFTTSDDPFRNFNLLTIVLSVRRTDHTMVNSLKIRKG
jgi:hypothetical protein